MYSACRMPLSRKGTSPKTFQTIWKTKHSRVSRKRTPPDPNTVYRNPSKTDRKTTKTVKWRGCQSDPAAASPSPARAVSWGKPCKTNGKPRILQTRDRAKVDTCKFLENHKEILEWGGAARTRDEIQARGAGRAGPTCPPSVRA